MLCIFKGVPKTYDRDEVRKRINLAIAPTETDPTCNHGVKGMYREHFCLSRVRDG